MDENSFKYVEKTPNWRHKLGVVRSNPRLIDHQMTHHIPSQPKTTTNQQENIKVQNKT